jgi:sterol desaturase/sphingolipid hydroxylase (fatty acid hydroxylase superfamily)
MSADALLANAGSLRLGAFVAVFALMAVWELAAPRRASRLPRRARWPGNLGIVVVDTLLLRLVFPTAAIGFAALVDARGWGLLTLLDWPLWLTTLAAIIALDLVVYLQHVLMHAIPLLWRLHRVHHTDLTIDVTTGLRFHPLEILLSMALKCAAIAALGPPVVAVLIFEIVLNAASMFNHGNAAIPIAVDRWLRLLIVTPDMHRVHHSVIRRETNSNFGFAIPWWDRCFGTYRAQPEAGHRSMTIGIEQFRDVQDSRLDRLLLQPWRAASTVRAVNREDEA